MIQTISPPLPRAESTSALELLESELRVFARFLANPFGGAQGWRADERRLALGVGRASLERWFEERRGRARALLTEAVAMGELPRGLELETVLDGLLGPLYYRFTMRHAPVSSAFAEHVFRTVVAGVVSRERHEVSRA